MKIGSRSPRRVRNTEPQGQGVMPDQPSATKKFGASRRSLSILGCLLLLAVLALIVVFVMLPRFSETESAQSRPAAKGKQVATQASQASTTVLSDASSVTTTTIADDAGNAVTTTTAPIGVRLHNTYGTASYFVYPGSWTAFALDDNDRPGEYQGQSFMVADLGQAYAGEEPRNAVQFQIITVPAGSGTFGSPVAIAGNLIATAHSLWGSASKTTVQSPQPIVVNGMDGAEATLRFSGSGFTMRVRLCVVVSGTTVCWYAMYAEEASWSKYEPIFEQALQSLDIGHNKTAPTAEDSPGATSIQAALSIF